MAVKLVDRRSVWEQGSKLEFLPKSPSFKESVKKKMAVEKTNEAREKKRKRKRRNGKKRRE